MLTIRTIKAKIVGLEVPPILWIATAVWTMLFTALGAWKYSAFLYRDLDLAYYTQVFWDTVRGDPFLFTFHPGFSLGDHAEWILLPLAVPFALFRHPVTLLFLQAAAIVAAVIPLYRYAARRLPSGWALGVSLAYLCLAVPMNAALFEFHLLIFALPFLLAAADAWDRELFRPFLIWLLLSLAVREDVTFAAIGFAAVSWSAKRDRRWILAPALLSIAIFLIDHAVIDAFSVGGGYKFSVYFGWLHGAYSLRALPAIEFLLGLFMPVLILPFLRPRWLALSVLPILGIIVQQSGGGATALMMHYATLMLPGILLASVNGLAALLQARVPRIPWTPLRGTDRALLVGILLLALATSAWTIGPLPGILRAAFRPVTDDARAAASIVRGVPPYASVAASDSLLAHLATRRGLYPLRYIYLGSTQYGRANYAVPELPDYIALDAHEALVYATHFAEIGWTEPFVKDGPARLRKLLADGRYGLVMERGPYALWARGAGSGDITPVIRPGMGSDAPSAVDGMLLHGIRREPDCGTDEVCLSLDLSLPPTAYRLPPDHAISLILKDEGGHVLGTETRLLGDHLFPTSSWQPGAPVRVRLRMLGSGLERATRADITTFVPTGTLVMGSLRTSELLIERPHEQGAIVPIK